MRILLGLMLVTFTVACGTTSVVVDDTDIEDDDDDQLDTDVEDTDLPAPTFATISGSATWSVEFDDASKAAGLFDCAYTRTYSGLEDRSAPWLCPECDVVYKADITLDDLDCYSQVTTADLIEQEWVGYGPDGYFRTYFENYRLSPQGSVLETADGYELLSETDWYEHSSGGSFRFVVTGSFIEAQAEGDVYHGFGPPEEHDCGWPTSEKPIELGKGPIEEGKPLPDGLFLDACGEGVRLHDFEGHYLVIDVSAMNCGPCQSMADSHGEFEAAMTAAGIDAEVITLLAPSLSDILSPTPASQLQSWIDTYLLDAPVLSDRGYGYWLLGSALGDEFGYPAWAVVSPELEVLRIWKGFSGWEDIETIITDHAAQ